jgi:4-aminobutyrate aminotransferase
VLPRIITPLPGPKAKAIIDRDDAVMSPSYTRSYPFVMHHGEGCLAVDPDGNSFLDFAAGIAVCATGHHHPHVTQAIKDQVDCFLHMSGTDFYYENQVRLAERLAAAAPMKGDKKVFFTNSGAEAIEAAFKLARFHTRRTQAISFFGAFHGRTMGALSLTASKMQQKKNFAPFVPGVTHMHYGYCYRCPYHLKYPACDLYCAHYLEDVLFKHTVDPKDVAAIFIEAVQGEGGYVVPPREFLEQLSATCRKNGILLVMDEVQSGMGRTGKMFAAEHFGIEPDILCLAKGIASGLPLGAIVTRKEVMTWEYGSHASTFGGNPVACAAALATMDLLEGRVEGVANGSLIENARVVGEHLKQRLLQWRRDTPVVGDVRGLGLMIGIEYVKNDECHSPNANLRNAVVDECFKRGMLVLGCGPNTLRLAPPLTLSIEQADWAAECIAASTQAACAAG